MKRHALFFVTGVMTLFMATGSSAHAEYEAARVRKAEVKVSIERDDIDRALSILGFSLSSAEDRRIFFYDTPKLTYFKQGRLLRARKTKNGGKDDSTVKMRPADLATIPASLKNLDGFKCEIDTIKNKQATSCSLTEEVDDGVIDRVFIGVLDIEVLFTGQQVFFSGVKGTSPLKFETLVPFGPIRSYGWKLNGVEAAGRRIDVEFWVLPAMVRFVELSVKVDTDEIEQAQIDLSHLLSRLGLRETSDPEAKTSFALKYFVP